MILVLQMMALAAGATALWLCGMLALLAYAALSTMRKPRRRRKK